MKNTKVVFVDLLTIWSYLLASNLDTALVPFTRMDFNTLEYVIFAILDRSGWIWLTKCQKADMD